MLVGPSGQDAGGIKKKLHENFKVSITTRV